MRTAVKSSWRQLVKIPLLLVLLMLHLPLTVLSLALLFVGRRPKRTTTTGVFLIVVPFEPGNASGGARAVKDLIELLQESVRPQIICLSGQGPRSWSLRAVVGSVLSWTLPIPSQCRPYMAGNATLQSRVAQADTVLFEFVSTALVLWCSRPTVTRVILRDHEVLARRIAQEYRTSSGLAAIVHALRLAVCYLVSLCIYLRTDRLVTLTDEDRSWIVGHFPAMENRTTTVPVAFVQSDVPAPPPFAGGPIRDLLMVANFFHSPNVDAIKWFLVECAPHLDPGYRLHLCGLDKPLDALDLSTSGLSVIRHGFVDDPSIDIPEAAIAVAPVISGGGVRMKNLFLASCQRVVVTTPLGNEGIGFVDGRDAIIASTGEEMARRINEVSRSTNDILRYGQAGRAFVHARFGPAALRERFKREVLA